MIRLARFTLVTGAMLSLIAGSKLRADAIYTYTGSNFTEAFGNAFHTSENVSITVDLSTALQPNAVSASITPLSWDAQVGSYQFLPPGGGLTSLTIPFLATDAAGNISDWKVIGISLPFSFVTSGTNGDQAEFTIGSGGGNSLALTAERGTWARVVPEPGSFFLGAGFFVLLPWLLAKRVAVTSRTG